MIVMDQLVDKFSRLSISDSIQILEVSKEFDFGTVMTEEINPESNLGFTSEVLSPYPLGLCNAIFIYQELLQGRVNPAQEIPLTGAQRGHVLSVTLQGFIVHWPGSHPDDSYPDSSRVIAMAEILPYQDGDSLPGDDHTPWRSSKALIRRSLLPTGFSCTPGRYLLYKATRHSVLQLRLISTRMTRALHYFPRCTRSSE
jgi:hypothetical protein